MTDAITEGINTHLEQENERLAKELTQLKAALGAPINVTVQSADSGVLGSIQTYMPQLTNIATNLSYVASAVQALAPRLDEIAKALKEQKP